MRKCLKLHSTIEYKYILCEQKPPEWNHMKKKHITSLLAPAELFLSGIFISTVKMFFNSYNSF